MTENNPGSQSQPFTNKVEEIEQNLTELKDIVQDNTVKFENQNLSFESRLHQLASKVEKSRNSYDSFIHIIGYGLLILSIFSIGSIFVPLRLTNPVWELQVIASLVDNTPILLIGIIFVFYGNLFRSKIERFILRIISWAALLMGIFFILLIPLGIRDSVRVNTQTTVQITTQKTQQQAVLQQLKEQANKATSPQDITRILNRVSPQATPANISNPQQLKIQALSRIAQIEQATQTQAQTQLKDRKIALFKDSFRFLVGSLVCGVLLIVVWRITSNLLQRG